ncbi:RAB6-interacting golgin [Stegastes partitus]|uniref:RAB6-interacting golgin n=1 Tax=Stegastes partitus TaxID=144197 RepID=A0A3B4ZZM8_9TELE|nr:PREDICTED: RAB6-interacting golgin [Stegastes partitus]XP_008279218.1 PREDICTED: RAB6-interacting golgin [Stegastes partitus]
MQHFYCLVWVILLVDCKMSGWAGFSDEELRRMQQKESAVPAGAARGRKPGPANRSRQQLQREKALQLAAQKTAGAGSPVLPPEQQLTKPPQREESQPATGSGAPNNEEKVQQKPAETKPNDNHEPAADEGCPPVQELEKQEVELREKSRLEQLQQERKLIEERNKRKKALLTKTIAEKSRQTQAEAVKLKRIQKELQALDDMVSNDIGILRGKIEQASWDYTAARKRYEKAEAEYVMAKLDLHKKTEVKEQLTEHLCAIIQQNELRKALKLEELMQQLQLQATEEELERQKEEEEEERRNCVEAQREEKEENSSVENQEGMVLSTTDCRTTGEEIVKKESRDAVQLDNQPVVEPSKPEQDCKTPENHLQSEIVAS